MIALISKLMLMLCEKLKILKFSCQKKQHFVLVQNKLITLKHKKGIFGTLPKMPFICKNYCRELSTSLIYQLAFQMFSSYYLFV